MTTTMIQPTWELQTPALPENDPIDVMVTAERADWLLLCMVSCVAIATLALGAASALLM